MRMGCVPAPEWLSQNNRPLIPARQFSTHLLRMAYFENNGKG